MLLLRHGSFAALLLAAAASISAAALPVPVTVEARFVTQPPKLDGVLDDECWQGLPDWTGFFDAQTRQPAPLQTVARTCYDKEDVYVAFHAANLVPGTIRAAETKRNGKLEGDDTVAVRIDSMHQHRYWSMFVVSAIGTQAEYLERSSSTNIGYKGDWQAAAKIVEDGYNVEMAIPFSLLVYGNRQDTFGICFVRYLAAEQIRTEWPDLNGTSDIQYCAHWKGVSPPDLKPRPKTLAYLLGTTGGGGSQRVYRGLDLKYTFSNDTAALISVTPDFSTVQQQVESADFSYTERLLSDNRPFFTEWQFPVDERVLYTRRIADFDVGAKLSGKSSPHTFGLLNAATFGQENDTVLTYRREIGAMSSVVFNLADRNTPGHRTTVTLYRARLGKQIGRYEHSLGGGVYSSATTGEPGGQCRWIHYENDGGDGAVNSYIDFGHVDWTFKPELGYTTDNGAGGPQAGVYRKKSYRGRNLRSVLLSLYGHNWKHGDGSPFVQRVMVEWTATCADGRAYSFLYRHGRREQFPNIGPTLTYLWNQDTVDRDGGLSCTWGKQDGGGYLRGSLAQKLKLGPRFVFGAFFSWERIGSPSPYAAIRRQAWATVNHDITPERGIGGRVVQQGGQRNIFLFYRQQVRRGIDAYVIYGDPNAEKTTGKLSVKLLQAF